ncbi:hypothetical protein JKP88DRAFT_318273 [Tribonema minus]|uniref:Uncharacterized protein n=1 Tax=Tribonema minus TaxID=303371 RepID=A0A835Z0I0_9STRA|nr:hypothetical protein JKP88DRAFT_318273 [Tribonema minus]
MSLRLRELLRLAAKGSKTTTTSVFASGAGSAAVAALRINPHQTTGSAQGASAERVVAFAGDVPTFKSSASTTGSTFANYEAACGSRGTHGPIPGLATVSYDDSWRQERVGKAKQARPVHSFFVERFFAKVGMPSGVAPPAVKQPAFVAAAAAIASTDRTRAQDTSGWCLLGSFMQPPTLSEPGMPACIPSAQHRQLLKTCHTDTAGAISMITSVRGILSRLPGGEVQQEDPLLLVVAKLLTMAQLARHHQWGGGIPWTTRSPNSSADSTGEEQHTARAAMAGARPHISKHRNATGGIAALDRDRGVRARSSQPQHEACRTKGQSDADIAQAVCTWRRAAFA